MATTLLKLAVQMPRLRRGLAVLAILAGALFFLAPTRQQLASAAAGLVQYDVDLSPGDAPIPHDEQDASAGRPAHRIVIADSVSYHDEVTGAFIYSLQATSHVPDVYLLPKGLRFGMSDIVREWFQEPYKSVKDDLEDLRAAIIADEIDLLILPTCSNSLGQFTQALLAPTAKGVHVACIVHHSNNLGKELPKVLPLADQGRLTFVALSEHVTKATKAELAKRALRDDQPQLKKCDVRTFVPVFPADVVTATRSTYSRPAIFPQNIVIQGNLEQSRRDYAGIFTQLQNHLEKDAAAWGYELDAATQVYKPLPASKSNAPPFQLHLLGAPTKLMPVPDNLAEVALLHPKLTFREYYHLMSSFDLLLPAFAKKHYFTSTASSSIGAGLITRLPILSTQALLNAYTYLAPPAYLLQPDHTLVVDHIAELRSKSRKGELPYAGAEAERTAYDAYLKDIEVQNHKLWDDLLGSPLHSKEHEPSAPET